MHERMSEWRERWRELHPTWTLVLWTDPEGTHHVEGNWRGRTLLTAPPPYQDLLGKACHLSQRSNIWRYLITSRYGGLYVDTDVEPFKAVDELVSKLPAFAARRRLPPDCPRIFECAFFGATPGHPWLRQVVAELPTRDPSVPLSMGVDYFTQVTEQHPEVVPLPEDLVLFQLEDWVKARSKAVVPDARDAQSLGEPTAFAKHHWSSTWFPESFKLINAPARPETASPGGVDSQKKHCPACFREILGTRPQASTARSRS